MRSTPAFCSATTLATILLCGTASIGQPAPVPQSPDTALVRLVGTMIRDSLARLADSSRAADSALEDRPARSFLRLVDTTAFKAHPGAVGPGYPLGPGDELVLSIWGQKQARYSLAIDRDGKIEIPQVGVVSLNGATFGSAHGIIRRSLASAYSGVSTGATQFDLTLAQLKQVRVMVIGDVARPGGYMLGGTTSAMQAVTLAGGPTPKGSDRFLRITRGDSSFVVDMYSYIFLGARSTRDVLQDGDLVTVPPASGTAAVRGAAARPGLYEVSPTEDAGSLFRLAGGAGPECDTTAQILLSTRIDGSIRSVLAGTPGQISSGATGFRVGASDVLTVPSRPKPVQGAPIVAGMVAHPGQYPITSESSTARAMVQSAGGPLPEAFRGRLLVFRRDSLGHATVLRTGLDDGEDIPVGPTDSILVLERASSPDSARIATVTGAVRSPGSFPWARGMTVKDLVLMAGGFAPAADASKIRLDERGADGKTVASRIVSLDPDLSARSGDASVPPDGIVVIPSNASSSAIGQVRVTGSVATQGSYGLIDGQNRVSDLVGRAGGILPVGYARGARLFRAGTRIPFDLGKALRSPGSADDVVLWSGDSLHVPLRPATVLVTGRVRSPREVLWRPGKDWKWYVGNAGGIADSAAKKDVFVEYSDGSVSTLSSGIESPDPGSIVTVPREVPPPPTTPLQKLSALNIVVGMAAVIITTWLLVEGRK